MNRGPLPTELAKFSLLQLALPLRPAVNIGVLLLDPRTDRLFMKLRRDWSAVADPEEFDYLEALAADLEAKSAEMGGSALLDSLEDTLSLILLVTDRQDVTVTGFHKALERLYEEHVERTEIIPFV